MENSNSPAAFFDWVWHKVNIFGSRGHQMKIIDFHGDVFSLIDLLMRYLKKATPCLPRRAGLKYEPFDLETSISKFDLRWNQVRGRSWLMTQIGQYAYLPKFPHKPNRLAPFARLYLHSVASYWRKTDCHLIWPQMTFPWPPIISCTPIITDGVSGQCHDPEKLGGFG